ncbi:MAG: hypothetical protein H0U03_05455 [Actinobacteria bacterium]|nr:hypothetical protein [Actinomycetota bacterium]
MSERDNDIEFDFFDEPATQEAAGRGARARRGPRRPVRPPAGITPILRLVGLIAFAILLIVLLVFWVQSCRGASKKSGYEDYMEEVRTVAGDSQRLGGELNSLITTRGIKQADLEQQLNGLAQQQQQIANAAQAIKAPGRLRGPQQHVVEAMRFRFSGLRGLEAAFRESAKTKNGNIAGARLAAQARRLDASDVIWDDLFKEPSIQELRRQGIGGVRVPDSNFVRNPDLPSPRSMKEIWQRIQGARTGVATTGGVHGNGIVRVRVLPSGQELSTTEDTTIVATTELAFEVVVENSGSSQEVRVPVTLTIQKSPTPIEKRQVISLINPGETQTVTFRNIGQPPFGPRTPVRVEVRPVPQEKNKANNTAEYNVFFTVE